MLSLDFALRLPGCESGAWYPVAQKKTPAIPEVGVV